MTEVRYGLYKSSIGSITVIAEDDEITMLDFCDCVEKGLMNNEWFSDLFQKLDMYFQGKRVEFTVKIRLPMNPFRQRVFKEVMKLRWGEITTYKHVAERIGSSPRAVGTALSKNQTLLLVPCHRVIAESGIGGYSRGVDIKRKLLKLEGHEF
jgi:methylated-DNA-[protein]-cysteine S-methyltransferase